MAKKTAAKKAAKKPSTKKSRVRIRMYRQGLGDCFLLTFDNKTHVLIDSGVIVGTKDPSVIMTDVANDIRTTTSKNLDVVVVTHEHWDHVSGFTQAKDVFDDIKFKRVWMAWTEDDKNTLANELRGERAVKLKAAKAAGRKLTGIKNNAALNALGKGIAQLLTFNGIPVDAADAGGDTGNAMRYVQDRGKAKGSEFTTLEPGKPPFLLPGSSNVRVYVLGPPEDKKLIKRSDPSKAHPEVYLSHASAFSAAAEAALTDDDRAVAEDAQPFASSNRIPAPRGELPTIASDGHRQLFAGYHSAGQSYRQIEDDWLASAGSFALKLDSDTNNTSLVLAFEFIDTGDVLLFPGDAQVGNWLSWDNYKWEVKDNDGGKRTVTATDLLNRTVFYKVGHHGSHNATLREGGLERMTSKNLVAMVPVNQEMAKKKTWQMPWPNLRARLTEVCSSLIVEDEGAPEKQPRRGKVKVTDLYIDYEL